MLYSRLLPTVCTALHGMLGLLILCQFSFPLCPRSRGHLRITFQQAQRTLSTERPKAHVSPTKRILYSESRRDARKAKNRAMLMYSTAVVSLLWPPDFVFVSWVLTKGCCRRWCKLCCCPSISHVLRCHGICRDTERWNRPIRARTSCSVGKCSSNQGPF